jgi:hypothetical protein
MSGSDLTVESPAAAEATEARKAVPGEKPVWETPKIEDVSEEVMAQPYIRFT